MGEIVVFGIVGHKIILGVGGDQGIGADNKIAADGMEPAVRAILVIGEGDFLAAIDSFADEIQVEKEGLVMLMGPGRQGMDMAHLMAEIDAPQGFELMDEAFGIALRDISGGHDTVDQNAQLKIVKFPFPEKIAPVIFLIGADIHAHFQKQGDIAGYGFSFGRYPIVLMEIVDELMHGKRMINIRIPAQNFQET